MLADETKPSVPTRLSFQKRNRAITLIMREIIYVQAGRYSNYTGTHFFNALESYFSYDDDDDAQTKLKREEVAHDVSFREGKTFDGTQTFCPRLLLFDYASNFGPLPKISALYAGEQQEDASTSAVW